VIPATFVGDGGPTGQNSNGLDPANWQRDRLLGPDDHAVLEPIHLGQPPVITQTGSATPTGATLRSQPL
jgi:hypothetical protein